MLQDATSTAQFLCDATLNGPGGRARPRPALLKLGMKRPGDWWPGEGFYTV